MSLGLWQMQRLQEKNRVIALIDARMNDAPVQLEEGLSAVDSDYLPVAVRGRFTGEELHVLAGIKKIGPSYRIISAFETDAGRRILVDRGYVPTEMKDALRPPVPVALTGILHTPQEVDSFTPAPDIENNIWFARDVPEMAQALRTEPTFVILSGTSETNPPVTPLPVDTAAIPNDHLGYAITWFSLAIVWLGMTAAVLWRIRQRRS